MAPSIQTTRGGVGFRVGLEVCEEIKKGQVSLAFILAS